MSHLWPNTGGPMAPFLRYPLFKRLAGKIQMHKFIIGTNSWIILASISFIVGMAGLITSLTIELPSHNVVWLITAISAITTALSLIKDHNEFRKLDGFYPLDIADHSGGITKKLKGEELKLPSEYDGYKVINHANYFAIYNECVNNKLRRSKFSIKNKKERFTLKGTSKDLAPFVLRDFFKTGALIFNSRKIRLLSDLTEKIFDANANIEIEIQETDYFTTLCTNDIATKTFYDSEHNLRFDGYAHFIEKDLNKLRGLKDSENICSNQMGGSTIAFSSDGKMHIVIQGSGNTQCANLLAPSGSGSFDFEDLDNKADFVELITDAINRELREECGISDKISINTILIGYARYLNRGGLPQFFGISYVNDTDHNFKRKTGEVPYVVRVDGKAMDRSTVLKFRKDLESYKTSFESNFSFVLWLNFKFLEDFLYKNPDEFIKFLHGEPMLSKPVC